MSQSTQAKGFYGWWITAAAFCTFGLSTGLPYYNVTFFYDYYVKTHGWQRDDILLGFPIAALLTLWVGPLVVPRFSPKKLILIGTALTSIAFVGFSQMTSLNMYYGMWLIYILGYIFSGPIPHQIIISQWFRQLRGRAMGVTYVGIGVFGGLLGPYVAKPLTEMFGFQTALIAIGVLIVGIAWPIAIFFLKDKPSDMGLNPDGVDTVEAEVKQPPKPFGFLLSKPSFWLLLVGSMCSIGAIGSINQHMKFVFLDQGYTDQAQLNSMWARASMMILVSSIFGRLLVGWLADRVSRKAVMIATYALVAATIPLLLLVRPENPWAVYAFALLFGFGMGADYMLIPLMAADQFGLNTLARAMAVILPTDTIGQTWFPWIIAKLQKSWGSYDSALMVVFGFAAVGALAIALLPGKQPPSDNRK